MVRLWNTKTMTKHGYIIRLKVISLPTNMVHFLLSFVHPLIKHPFQISRKLIYIRIKSVHDILSVCFDNKIPLHIIFTLSSHYFPLSHFHGEIVDCFFHERSIIILLSRYIYSLYWWVKRDILYNNLIFFSWIFPFYFQKSLSSLLSLNGICTTFTYHIYLFTLTQTISFKDIVSCYSSKISLPLSPDMVNSSKAISPNVFSFSTSHYFILFSTVL